MPKPRFKQPQAEKGKGLRSHAEAEPSPQTLPPHFSFEHLCTDVEFSLDGCDKDQKSALSDRIIRLSKMTWAEIQQAHKHGLGFEKIDSGSIKSPIPSWYKDDHVLVFRFAGLAAMAGYRDRRVFYVMWLDPKFKLYPHE